MWPKECTEIDKLRQNWAHNHKTSSLIRVLHCLVYICITETVIQWYQLEDQIIVLKLYHHFMCCYIDVYLFKLLLNKVCLYWFCFCFFYDFFYRRLWNFVLACKEMIVIYWMMLKKWRNKPFLPLMVL